MPANDNFAHLRLGSFYNGIIFHSKKKLVRKDEQLEYGKLVWEVHGMLN